MCWPSLNGSCPKPKGLRESKNWLNLAPWWKINVDLKASKQGAWQLWWGYSHGPHGQWDKSADPRASKHAMCGVERKGIWLKIERTFTCFSFQYLFSLSSTSLSFSLTNNSHRFFYNKKMDQRAGNMKNIDEHFECSSSYFLDSHKLSHFEKPKTWTIF